MDFKQMAITSAIVILFIYGFKWINKQWPLPIAGKILEEI